MKHGLRVAAIALCMVGGVAAADQPKKPDAAALKKANNHFKLGQEFFKSGQWDRAIAEYQAALDLTGEPLMIFNIGLAHDRANRPEEALANYLKYLELGPDGPIADEARGYVAKLTPIVDKRRKAREAAEAKKAEADRKRQEEEARKAAAARKVQEAHEANVERDERARTIERHGKIQTIAGLVFGVAGAGVVAYGVKRGLDAQSISDELSNHEGAWTDAQIARDAEGKSANRQMFIFTAAGAGAVITGAVLFVIGRGAHGRAERSRVEATPLPGGGSASVAWRF